MTREENLHWIDQEIQTWENECQSKHPIKEALHAARKALEQKPCEDAVSRQMVKDTIFVECSGTKLDIDFAKVLLLQRAIKALPPVTPQEPNTWSLDDAREDFMHDVYNELDFLPTNDEANRIIDSFDMVTKGIKQEPRWIPVAERLPNNPTNGDVIKALFNETEYPKLIRLLMTSDSFWKAPYKGGQKDGNDN